MKLSEKIAIFLVTGLITAIICTIKGHVPFLDALIGCGIIVGVTIVGIILAQVIPGNLPMVFWISVLAIFIATPLSPVASFVSHYVAKVDFLAICTVVLTYAGLTIGKDLGMFKKMSWRIIIVALAVYTGTFVCATCVSQIVLHFEGVI